MLPGASQYQHVRSSAAWGVGGDAEPPRPDGELVWAHAGDPARLAALGDLAERLTWRAVERRASFTSDGLIAAALTGPFTRPLAA